MDGIIIGEHAERYDPNRDKSRKLRQNSFINRNIKKGATCIDFACGNGMSTELLLSKCGKIYGIEASKDMLKICRNRFSKNKKVELIEANVLDVPLNDKISDYVLIRMGLHHIEDKKGVMKEAHRLLKNGGKVIIIDKFAIQPKIVTVVFDFLSRITKNAFAYRHYYSTINEFRETINALFIIEEDNSSQKEFTIKANIVLRKI